MRRTAISLALWAAALGGCGGGTESVDPGPILLQPDGGVAVPNPTGVEPEMPKGGKVVPGPTRYFPREAIWNHDVSDAPLDGESARVIAGLAAAGGFGTGSMLIDFELVALEADDSAPMMTFTPTKYFYAPDCDHVPVPVPPVGALESMPGYGCPVSDSDCHLIVHHRPSGKLYEMWRADIRDGVFRGGCLAVWDTRRLYGAKGRGMNCTSADAAGLPIAPLLFSADEVASGAIEHAARFVLPNGRIRRNVYVAPATHSTSATRGGPDTPPYGARFRLRRDFPVDLLPTEGARVVARALQRYGMFLADGGNEALTAQDDRFTTAKWGAAASPSRLLGERDLVLVKVTDFEMVQAGPRVPYADDACVREP